MSLDRLPLGWVGMVVRVDLMTCVEVGAFCEENVE